MSDTEENLQTAVYKLNQIITIFAKKTSLMSFKGRDPGRNKCVTDNKIIEKVHSFNCLGYLISYEKKWALTTN
jgi:hypothetical protein